jgi:hypothetical protein
MYGVAELGFSGLYHDEAGVTSSAYSTHMWDGVTVFLDPITKHVVGTPGSVGLLRLRSKLQLLEVVLKHQGVLQMNGPPITRTFRCE